MRGTNAADITLRIVYAQNLHSDVTCVVLSMPPCRCRRKGQLLRGVFFLQSCYLMQVMHLPYPRVLTSSLADTTTRWSAPAAEIPVLPTASITASVSVRFVDDQLRDLYVTDEFAPFISGDFNLNRIHTLSPPGAFAQVAHQDTSSDIFDPGSQRCY